MPQIKISTNLRRRSTKGVQTHTIKGYNILKGHSTHIHVQMTAMMHHERCDGTGCPMGLHSDKLTSFTKDCHDCPMYDAMTSRRPYQMLCPMEVKAFLKRRLDTFCARIPFSTIKDSYENENVVLRRTEGKIVLIRKNDISNR